MDTLLEGDAYQEASRIAYYALDNALNDEERFRRWMVRNCAASCDTQHCIAHPGDCGLMPSELTCSSCFRKKTFCPYRERYELSVIEEALGWNRGKAYLFYHELFVKDQAYIVLRPDLQRADIGDTEEIMPIKLRRDLEKARTELEAEVEKNRKLMAELKEVTDRRDRMGSMLKDIHYILQRGQSEDNGLKSVPISLEFTPAGDSEDMRDSGSVADRIWDEMMQGSDDGKEASSEADEAEE